MKFTIQDTFNKELPADPNRNNTRRQVKEACFSFVHPRVPSDAKLIHVSEEMAKTLGLSKEDITSQEFLEVFSGAKIRAESDPYSMCYGGHQFGNWAGQLGDGRAINLMEIVHDNKSWALQLKGAGETPYSRTADGLAVLRSSIREHLASEAMYHLGVPTTRSLSLMLSGDQVLRDILYNGNAAYEKGAILCRVAPSFIRFGNFQIFTSRNDIDNLKKLADYTLRHFFPQIKSKGKDSYIEFFQSVVNSTLKMILHWQRVGFVHGVMNTDNMSILGLSIDYGPYGFLDNYEKDWTPNTTDAQTRRYRYANQPGIGLWNLYQLANALFPLVGEPQPFEDALKHYDQEFNQKYLDMMRAKLGLESKEDKDAALIADLEKTLELTETDMTLFFRLLGRVNKGDRADKALEKLEDAFYLPEEIRGEIGNQWMNFLEQYLERLKREEQEDGARKASMNAVNPKYILRNYMAQLALDAADEGDYGLIEELYQLLKHPYAEQPESEKWFAKRPDWARHKVGCSMLSCSS